MDRNNWNRNVELWIEHWREQRFKKMANRLQLHSTKPRTISSSILGFGNNRQQITVPPCPRHSRVDCLWNSNYHSGFREHNSIHKKYHHADQRGNRPLYQSGQKIVYFGSQQSLNNERKSIHKLNRKHSSCDNINDSGIEGENQNDLNLSEPSEPDCSATEDVATDVRNLDCLSDANEEYLPEPHPIVDNCSAEVAEIIGAIPVIDSNLDLTGNISSNSQEQFLDVESSISLNAEMTYNNEFSKHPTKSHGYLLSEQENFNVIDEKLSAAIIVRYSEECLTTGSHFASNGRSATLALEATCKGADETTENILKAEEISSEPISSIANASVADKFSDLEISFSNDPEVKVMDTMVEPIVYVDTASKLNPEAAVQSASNVKPTKEDAFILNVVKTGITKEIESVENRFANISIAQKDDLCRDSECRTPMKRERKNMLLDATNILPSSTIKYAVREVRKNDELEALVTPVRRSLRISSVTPVSSKNMCVESLKELSPQVFQKIKFVPNPAIDIPPDC